MKPLSRSTKAFIPKADKIVKLSNPLKVRVLVILVVGALTSIISEMFVFLFQGATNSFANNDVVLGLVLFFIYIMKNPIRSIFTALSSQFNNSFELANKVDITTKSIEILGVSKGKIKDGSEDISSTTILNVVSEYISGHRNLLIKLYSRIINLITFIISFVMLLLVALEQFNPLFFISSLTITFAIIIFITFQQVKKNRIYAKEQYEIYIVQEQEKNDAINLNPICNEHMSYMVNNFISSLKKHCKSKQREMLNILSNNLIKELTLSLSVIAVILNAIFNVGIRNITSETFLSFIALTTIYENVLSSLSSKIREIQQLINDRNALLTKQDRFDKIIEVYNRETSMTFSDLTSNSIQIYPFSFSYNNNFTLINTSTIYLEKGKMNLLKGPSGAGKSTLLSIISGDLLIENLPKYRTIRFSSSQKLGCKNLLREITFASSEENVDTEKLIKILKGICLYDDFVRKANGENILQYLSHTFGDQLSTGLQQRALLARTLYHLDKGDIVIIDEPIGALDTITALKVLNFIKQYVCIAEQKLLLITTHQYEIYSEFDTVIELKKNGRVTTI